MEVDVSDDSHRRSRGGTMTEQGGRWQSRGDDDRAGAMMIRDEHCFVLLYLNANTDDTDIFFNMACSLLCTAIIM